METKIVMREGVRIIQLRGRMSFEAVDTFRLRCVREFLLEPVVFNLDGLNFVGSNGIGTLLETIQEMNQTSKGQVRLCNLGSEFRRIFEANGFGDDRLFECEDAAFQSFFATEPTTEAVVLPTLAQQDLVSTSPQMAIQSRREPSEPDTSKESSSGSQIFEGLS
jgi:anti-anti-sigma factor